MEGVKKDTVGSNGSVNNNPAANSPVPFGATAKLPVVIITGASGSVGKAATIQMASEGYHVIMACRNLKKAQDVADDIIKKCPQASIELMELELSSRESIRRFAEQIKNYDIDILFNNAGLMARRYGVTEDNIEQDMAVNYLGTALLTRLLIPYMRTGARIINMVSLTTRFAKLDINWQQWEPNSFGQLSTYGSSKLAVLYHSIALAKHHPELHINVADPGIVDSNMITMGRWYDPLADIFFRPFIKTPEQGAVSSINAMHSNESMLYFVGNKAKPISKRFMNSPLVNQLWQQLDTILA